VDVRAEKAAIKDMTLYAKIVAHDPDMANFETSASENIVGWALPRRECWFPARPGVTSGLA